MSLTEENIYIVVNKKESTCFSTTDRTTIASKIGVHDNTLKYRLRNGYFENKDLIIAKSVLYRTKRGRISFKDKQSKSND
jgi:hypothetical protein